MFNRSSKNYTSNRSSYLIPRGMISLQGSNTKFLQKSLMQTGIARKFRMERERQVLVILNANNSLIYPGENGNPRSSAGHNRCPDENRVERTSVKPFDRDICFKRLPLSPECAPIPG